MMNRRNFLRGIGFTTAAVLAGCAGNDESDPFEITENPYDGLELEDFELENSNVRGMETVTLTVTYTNNTDEELQPALEITVYDSDDTILAEREVDNYLGKEEIPPSESIKVDYDFRGDVEDVSRVEMSVTDEFE